MSTPWGLWSALEARIAPLEDSQVRLVVDYIDERRNNFPTLHVTWSFRLNEPKGCPNLVLARIWNDIGYTDGTFFRIFRHSEVVMPHAVMLNDLEIRSLCRSADFVSSLMQSQQSLPFEPQ